MKTPAASFDLDNMTDHNIAYGLPQIVFEIDQSGRIIFVNRSAFDAFGYTEEDFVQGLNVFQMIIPEEVEKAKETIAHRFTIDKGTGMEFNARRKDGSTFPVIINSNPIINKDGTLGLIGIIIDITKQKEIEEKLRESEENYRSIFDAASDAIYVHELETGRILDVNRRMCEMFQTTPEEARSISMVDTMVGEGQFTPENALQLIARASAGEPQIFEWLAMDKHGRRFWVEVNLKRAVIGGQDRLLAIVRDIDERRKAETALKEHEQRLKDIINFLPDPTLVINLEGQVIAWNRAMEELTGVKAEDMLGRGSYEYSIPFYGTRRPMLVDLVSSPDQEIEKKYINLKRENGALVAEGDNLVIQTSSEKRRAHIWAKATPLYDSQGNIVGAIETFRDITERREMENRLRYLNLHDSLTDLYNRAYFEEEMRRLDDGRHHPVGLMVCDLDGLKLVNDTLGHDTGDALLVAAARVLKSCFRESDMVARIGGDEFAMLLPNSPLSTVESAYQRIRDAIDSYNSSQTELHLSISVGYAVSNDSSSTMSDLYKEADNNMYREKLHSRRSARSTLVRTLMKEFLDKWEVGAG